MPPTDALSLGDLAPTFALPDLHETRQMLPELVSTSAATVIFFSSNHCPYVKHIEIALGDLARELASEGVSFMAICPNDVTTHPEDGVPGLLDQAKRAGWEFHYLVDESQDVARTWGAACTPDFFVLDGEGRLRYRGAMDESSPGNGKVNDGAALRTAVAHAIRGENAPEPQVPPMGCGIKWKA